MTSPSLEQHPSPPLSRSDPSPGLSCFDSHPYAHSLSYSSDASYFLLFPDVPKSYPSHFLPHTQPLAPLAMERMPSTVDDEIDYSFGSGPEDERLLAASQSIKVSNTSYYRALKLKSTTCIGVIRGYVDNPLSDVPLFLCNIQFVVGNKAGEIFD
ncbi:hypothetical protein WR25_02098 [Diploscapter pachys]|uniref:Uncharacterized protein n=1 Tax=Diploscapter pachys TaxID=2018661 RepID=A0A2A2K6H2_9BILA|nr:hypothetical protein WR25_02098 [Diploscapter pachys]